MNEVLPPGIRRSRAVPETLVRIVSYSATRLVALFLTVVVGVYLTILVANMGGYVDVIKRAEIREGAIFRVLADPKMMRLPSEDRKSTRLNSSHVSISYAVFCLKKK